MTAKSSVPVFVLDTSAFINNPSLIDDINDAEVIIPIQVLEELDVLKVRDGNTGMMARRVNRYLESLRSDGSMVSGVETATGALVKVVTIADVKVFVTEMPKTMDNLILSVAYQLKASHSDITLLSHDIALRLKADSFGIKATGVMTSKHIDHFSGLQTFHTDGNSISDFYQDGRLFVDSDLFPNEAIILKSGQQSALGIANSDGYVEKLAHVKKSTTIQGISPRSAEQQFAFDFLMNPDIHMVTLTGIAGTGKTLLSIAAAIDQLMSGRYKKVVLARPVQSMSKDIGFLPGTKEEKMAPWLQPFFDNIEVMLGDNGSAYIRMMMEKGSIQVEALSHIRGRTLPNTVFIIDEAQNITHHEAKAVLTRMGENSKIILIGDLAQIDAKGISEESSGLSSVVSLFKDFEHSAHITLVRGERSKLADFACKVM